MFLAILYEDERVFIKFTPEEFTEELSKMVEDGKTVKQAIDILIKKIKQTSLTK